MASKKITSLREFPSVEELLQEKSLAGAINSIPRPVASECIKLAVANMKELFKQGKKGVTTSSLRSEIRSLIASEALKQITPVVNATGIVVHTNLGRAPISETLFDAVRDSITGYTNVEFGLAEGKRGRRGEACENYLSLLSGAEAATVVNNCAAALFLILNTFANRKAVVLSRGELVQIGGGFRIPDILKKSGARLAEVGATNITTLSDYEAAINEKTGLILKVHQSNFAQSGFTETVSIKDLIPLAQKHSIPLINDLGSGVLVPTGEILGHVEPTVQQSVKQGAELTCFSGDKMLGGMQCGLIVGKAELITKIKKNPLFRTMRVDKTVFAMLEKLMTAYLNGSAEKEIKLWQLLSVSESELYRRGKKIHGELGRPSSLSVEATRAFVGGGALPESDIPSVGIVFSDEFKATHLMKLFRQAAPPIIGRIENDRFILDLKAVDESQLAHIQTQIKKLLN
ncbi:MAG: L-seryl-tRNA(Sec) selenium transferase [bacterium]|nr:L-seryl-tRNA(Sec) selenium transferase [bacterium]